MSGAATRRWALGLLLAFAVPAAAEEPVAVRQVALGVYVRQGVQAIEPPPDGSGIANIGFIVGEKAVAVIDSGGSARQGQRLIAAVREVTQLPIDYLILTHVHPDHTLGAAAFEPEQPVIIGHVNLPRALTARGGYYLERLQETLGEAAADSAVVYPDRVVEDRLEIDLGNRILEVTAHPTGHSDNDLTVYDRRTRTLWAADLVFLERLPVVDGSLKGWLAVLESLSAVPATRVVPGHGPASAPWPKAVAPQQRYLEALLAETRAVIGEGGTIEQALERVGRNEREHWLLFDEVHPRNVVTAFTELEWE